MYIESMEELQLTNSGLLWVLTHCKPILSLDFAGYAFNFKHKKTTYTIFITIGGFVIVCREDGKGIVSGRDKISVLKHLICRSKLLTFRVGEPFPEYSPSHNLPFDLNSVIHLNGYLFRTCDKQGKAYED